MLYLHLWSIMVHKHGTRGATRGNLYYTKYWKIWNSVFMHFCPGTMTTHEKSINSDLQCGLDRLLEHTQHWTQYQLAIKVSADN